MSEKRAPVQGYAAGIPWSLHLEAYDVYCKRYGPQKELIEGWCRGGFAVEELDMFIPGWRERVSEWVRLRGALEEALREIKSITQDPKPEQLALPIFAKLRHLELQLEATLTGQPYGFQPAAPEASA